MGFFSGEKSSPLRDLIQPVDERERRVNGYIKTPEVRSSSANQLLLQFDIFNSFPGLLLSTTAGWQRVNVSATPNKTSQIKPNLIGPSAELNTLRPLPGGVDPDR